MQAYTLWCVPYRQDLFPGGPDFGDVALREHSTFDADDDDNAICRISYNQLQQVALLGKRTAWKLYRGDNQDPLDNTHKVEFGWIDPIETEHVIGVMGGPEKAFEYAISKYGFGRAIQIVIWVDHIGCDTAEWESRKYKATNFLDQEINRLYQEEGLSELSIAARLGVSLNIVERRRNGLSIPGF